MLDLHKLVLLREIEARGSIADAARALAYSRSAVSQQITALERELGRPLLERSHRRVTLTPVARMLVAHTERVLAELEAAQTEIDRLDRTPHGELRLGVSFNHGPPLLAQALVRVQRHFPDLHITLRGVAAGAGRQAVRLGQLDLVLAFRYDQVPEPRIPGLVEIPLGSDPVRIAVAVGHPLATGGGPLEPAAFARERWAFDPDSTLGRLTVHVCHEAGFEPVVGAIVDDMQAALGLVSPGWAVSLLPDLVPDRPEFPVARLPLAGRPLLRHTAVVMRRGTVGSPAVEALLAELRALAEDRSAFAGPRD